jgi:hypothetical protein
MICTNGTDLSLSIVTPGIYSSLCFIYAYIVDFIFGAEITFCLISTFLTVASIFLAVATGADFTTTGALTTTGAGAYLAWTAFTGFYAGAVTIFTCGAAILA